MSREWTIMTARDFILPSFFGDALALGPHWIYDLPKIHQLYPAGIRKYDVPRSSYHPGKSAGDFTHYGDQTLLLLESVAAAGENWTPESWRDTWTSWGRTTASYRDGATRETLERLDAGLDRGSDSHDLGGASRIAPLFLLPPDRIVRAAREQTAVTHGDPQVIDAAEFFARAALSLADGVDFDAAFDEAASHPYEALPAIDWLAAAREATTGDLAERAEELGIACSISGAFPLTLTLALRYAQDPVAALEANALTGGDSAARGLLLGLLMGARHGAAALPEEWLRDLRAGPRIETLLAAASGAK